MQIADIPLNEKERFEALKRLDILDTLPEDAYDTITKIASEICSTPIALVSLIDPKRQWFKSNFGLKVRETPRDLAFCTHSILEPDKIFVVPDATKDHRFHYNPLTTGDPHVIFYAGVPLTTSDGYALGTLCVIDNKPRKKLTKRQKSTLKALAKQVMILFELRKKNFKLEQANKEISRLNEELNHFAYRLTHDLKTPIRGINSLAEFIKQDFCEEIKGTEADKLIDLITSRTIYMESMIEQLLAYTQVTNAEINFESFNIKELLENILKNCDLENAISIDMRELNVSIFHSRISLLQIFQNLLVNSKKFCDKEICEVQISLIEQKDKYQFLYLDNGPGISENYHKKIFLMFETLDSNNHKNNGIGLATVKSIITRLGGYITLKNRADNKNGVCFEFTINKSNFHEKIVY